MQYDFSAGAVSNNSQASDKLRDGGTYILIAESLEGKPTKKGDGVFISAKFKVADGPCRGKTIWGNYNVKNPSEIAEEIGKAAMRSLAVAVGEDPTKCDLARCQFIPFLATLKQRRDDSGESRFEVTKFTALEESEKERVVSSWTTAGNGDSDAEMPF